MDEWYSDEALRKQAALAAWPKSERPPMSMLCGIWEPRVPPREDEKCVCCLSDARPDAGGDGRHCELCIGRGHDEEDEG